MKKFILALVTVFSISFGSATEQDVEFKTVKQSYDTCRAHFVSNKRIEDASVCIPTLYPSVDDEFLANK